MKKFLSIMVALAMVASMSVPALAADGDTINSPKGTTGDGIVASTGNAVLEGDNFNVTDDDDAVSSATDTDGAQINVWAKVINTLTKVYKVDIKWGAMKFEFNSNQGTWDPVNHEYTTGTGTATWVNDVGTDIGATGVNNKITVTNHSNSDVKATFAYNADGKSFGDNSAGPVIGNFFDTNDKAAAASAILAYTNADTEITNKMDISTPLTIASADNTDGVSGEPKIYSKVCYFAFSGTPGAGNTVSNTAFEKVGTITVTISK